MPETTDAADWYGQELQILKYNLMQCQMQEGKARNDLNFKEDKLYESFSNSPSPNRGNQFSDNKPDPAESSPTKINKGEVSNPANVLEDNLYLKLLRGGPVAKRQPQLDGNSKSANMPLKRNDLQSPDQQEIQRIREENERLKKSLASPSQMQSVKGG